jgi:hypothetical protein
MSSSLVSRIGFTSVLALTVVAACSGPDKGGESFPVASGGTMSAATTVGGAASAAIGGGSSGGANGVGGSNATGGSVVGGNATGGAATGGANTTGGTATQGGGSTGGTNAGGAGIGATGGNATGGKSAGGSNTGGNATMGGNATGGKATGGSATGGNSQGGSATGGKAAGGSSTGGNSQGGTSTGGSSVGGSATGGNSVGGSATGGSGTTTGADGCSDTLALGLTMSEVAIYQTGKISIMKNGSAVDAVTTYGADVVEGKKTLFRVYVTTDSGFQSRQLSARLTLNGGSTPYYEKKTIASSSTELSATNSFQIAVPTSEIKSGLNYSVQIVECATGSGTAHSPRFPASGSSNVTTRATGTMNITLVPMTANGITPTLSSLATNFKTHLEALYPTNLAQITVATTPITGCGITPSTAVDGTTWSNCLTLVRSRRTADKPASDVYYVGIVTPASTYRGYCGSGCIAGVGYVATSASSASARALVSIGYEPDGLMTIAHELGHNHGLNHSPGCNADSADTAFPYQTNGTSYIGWVGWDNRAANTFIDPSRYTDLMAYCTPVWVSDYVYSKLADRVAALNGSAMLQGSDAVATWRVLDVVGGRATWGTPITDPAPAFGEPASGTVLDRNGGTLLEISVYRTNMSNGLGAMYLVPEPATNWASLRIGSTSIAF